MANGIGKTSSHDWSYLTECKAILFQTAVITDPTNIADASIIDLTVMSDGVTPASRGQRNMLVITATPLSSGTLAATSVLYLWRECTWTKRAEDETPSSSDTAIDEIPRDADAVSAKNKWAIVAAASIDNNSLSTSQTFVFNFMPAGRYKAAIGSGTITGTVVISEQHTE